MTTKQRQFMEQEITRKGTLVSCECAKCGTVLYTHEWASADFNAERDAMHAGLFRCDECGRTNDPNTVTKQRAKEYAGRMSAPGCLDATPWVYDTNKRRLQRTLREFYGEG